MPPSGTGGRLAHFWQKEIWREANRGRGSLRACVCGVFRVMSISGSVFVSTKAASRAAALSFSSLIGLGPLIAIAMPVAALVLGQNTPDLAATALNRILKFVAPQVVQFDQAGGGVVHGPHPAPAALGSLVNGVVAGARSGSAGVLGALSLIFVVLLLFKSIEDVFNEIWGVRRGRHWLLRVVFYWALVTLGAVLFFAAVALMGASAFVNVFVGHLPFGHELVRLLRWLLPVFSLLFLVGMLTAFYRVIPNTRVYWRAAFSGAVVVAVLLLLNNFMAFFYLSRVIQTRSFYGSLGLVLVLMFGLYIFWLYVLIGGQISYAVQNAHYRNSQTAWANLSIATRERLSLAVLLAIGRRFQNCLPPASASELGRTVRVPSQILNECINCLVDMRFVAPVPSAPGAPAAEMLYQPARPLGRITLLEFKCAADNLGENPLGEGMDLLDPVAREFGEAVARCGQGDFLAKTIEDLLREKRGTS